MDAWGRGLESTGPGNQWRPYQGLSLSDMSSTMGDCDPDSDIDRMGDCDVEINSSKNRSGVIWAMSTCAARECFPHCFCLTAEQCRVSLKLLPPTKKNVLHRLVSSPGKRLSRPCLFCRFIFALLMGSFNCRRRKGVGKATV